MTYRNEITPKSDTTVWHWPETPLSLSNLKSLGFQTSYVKIGKAELKFTPSWCRIKLSESRFSFFFLSGMAFYLRKINVHCRCRKRFNLFGSVIEGWAWLWFQADVWQSLGSRLRWHLQASGINACEMEYSMLTQTVSLNLILWVLSSLRHKHQMWAVSAL